MICYYILKLTDIDTQSHIPSFIHFPYHSTVDNVFGNTLQ